MSFYNYFSGGNILATTRDKYGSYVLASAGPDQDSDTRLSGAVLYDPTNGSVSDGDVIFSHFTTDEATLAARLAATATP